MAIPSEALTALEALHPAGTSFRLSNSEHIHASSPSSTAGISRYLLKTAPAGSSSARQLKGEAESIRLQNLATGKKGQIAPRLVATSDPDSQEYWRVSEWHQLSSLSGAADQAALGRLLAYQHQAPVPTDLPQGRFGFASSTFCGVTEQNNGWEDNWATFWSKRRIGDMLARIGDAELSAKRLKLCDELIPRLLGHLKPQPSLLHGDLWSGNVSISSELGTPFTFDPSSYFGHNEAELGMTRMFGGFTSQFYEAYHEIFPKAEPVEEYDQRQKLYELYHHLNHTLMFGGSYKSGALGIIKGLEGWYDSLGEKEASRL